MFHFGTIKKYTAALLDLFNSMEIQYTDSNNNIISRSIPIKYSVKEKSTIFDEYTTEQLLTGNYNVLPRASLSLVSLIKSDDRVLNKNMKINKVQNELTYDFMYNSVPYEFTYELNIQCRGMNEATMIVEQILPKFNPIYNLDVWDVQNLDEPTRIPVRLLDISISSEDYEELSQNIITVTGSISIMGNIYPPIKSIDKAKKVNFSFNELNNSNPKNTPGVTTYDSASRKSMIGWDPEDISTMTSVVLEGKSTALENQPIIIDLVATNFNMGDNKLTLIYTDADNTANEVTIVWELIDGTAELIGDGDMGMLTVTERGSNTVKVTITDIYGNYTSVEKTFTI